MKRGKLIVIEGTDCSGKETQTNSLIEKLEKNKIPVFKFGFPQYTTPTGRIVGGPYLGKSYICDGWFPEEAPNVDPKVSSLYYAADRRYNMGEFEKHLEKGENVILDRYSFSNMAHQGGKLNTKEERLQMFKWIEKLEFDMLELPKPDIKVFLHMPYEASLILKQSRGLKEDLDENERDSHHLICAETAYIELADEYKFFTIECASGDNIKTIEEINNELYNYVIEQLK